MESNGAFPNLSHGGLLADTLCIRQAIHTLVGDNSFRGIGGDIQSMAQFCGYSDKGIGIGARSIRVDTNNRIPFPMQRIGRFGSTHLIRYPIIIRLPISDGTSSGNIDHAVCPGSPQFWTEGLYLQAMGNICRATPASHPGPLVTHSSGHDVEGL